MVLAQKERQYEHICYGLSAGLCGAVRSGHDDGDGVWRVAGEHRQTRRQRCR